MLDRSTEERGMSQSKEPVLVGGGDDGEKAKKNRHVFSPEWLAFSAAASNSFRALVRLVDAVNSRFLTLEMRFLTLADALTRKRGLERAWRPRCFAIESRVCRLWPGERRERRRQRKTSTST